MQEIKLFKYWTVTFDVNKDYYYTLRERHSCNYHQVINTLAKSDRTIRLVCKIENNV